MLATSRLTLVGLALVVVVALSGQAFSATVAVGSCTTLVNFATIQQAVNAVPAGSTIKICPGNYHEQVVISEKLTLQGITYAGGNEVVILPPTTGLVQNTTDPRGTVAAQILVQNTDGPVVISNLTVDGTGNQVSGCSPDLRGILYQNASGSVNHVAARNQLPNDALSGCQSGQGIFVETDNAGGTATVTVENSSVHNYNKNGIVARYAGATMTATGNYVQGSGVVPSGDAAQNGIEIAFGAGGKIVSNTVIENIYGDPTVADSSGILLFDAAENSAISVASNTVGDSQVPIGLYTDTAGLGDGVSVTLNKILGTSTADAIDVCTNGNTIKNNTIFNSAESGIHFDASCGSTGNNNTANGNTFVESSCAGILSDSATSGNTTGTENFYSVPFTITSSTSTCTIPAGPAKNNGSNAKHRLIPAP